MYVHRRKRNERTRQKHAVARFSQKTRWMQQSSPPLPYSTTSRRKYCCSLNGRRATSTGRLNRNTHIQTHKKESAYPGSPGRSSLIPSLTHSTKVLILPFPFFFPDSQSELIHLILTKEPSVGLQKLLLPSLPSDDLHRGRVLHIPFHHRAATAHTPTESESVHQGKGASSGGHSLSRLSRPFPSLSVLSKLTVAPLNQRGLLREHRGCAVLEAEHEPPSLSLRECCRGGGVAL
mmetsp:Transcript_55103/g.107757  ORF Transcript_55103/g.107757 Transcript_55103/m.107757 type:complete len:234 (+) Transcript_55103:971-1672(+)